MAPFIRVTWTDVDDDELRNIPQEDKKSYGLHCNLKELEAGVYVQKKDAIKLLINGQFDSHLYEVIF
jgi:hypothetical protein